MAKASETAQASVGQRENTALCVVITITSLRDEVWQEDGVTAAPSYSSGFPTKGHLTGCTSVAP